MNILQSLSARLFATLILGVALTTFGGCSTKEKVIDIETPAGEVEVERDKETGETDVEVNSND